MTVATQAAFTDEQIRLARRWAAVYRERGYQPLPSSRDRKKPLVRYKDLWESMAPADLWDRHPSGNIQVMLGRYWNLCVIDLDGPEAIARWRNLWFHRVRTWVSSTGDHGEHWWFSIPTDGPPFPKRKLWAIWNPDLADGKGDWEKHKAIELLADRSLVMAPPSIHPKTGKVYRFQAGRSPLDIFRPAPLPAEVLGLPVIEAPRPEWTPPPVAPVRVPSKAMREFADRTDILRAIDDKRAVAASWGLRFAANPCESDDWVSVHDFNRADRNPSARFNLITGRFWRPGEIPISLFDLGAALGAYADWKECMDDLATQYLGRR